jgi:hypothetical protein
MQQNDLNLDSHLFGGMRIEGLDQAPKCAFFLLLEFCQMDFGATTAILFHVAIISIKGCLNILILQRKGFPRGVLALVGSNFEEVMTRMS